MVRLAPRLASPGTLQSRRPPAATHVQKRQDSYLRRERALETEVAQLKHNVAILRGENATTFLEASEKGQAQQAKQIS